MVNEGLSADGRRILDQPLGGDLLHELVGAVLPFAAVDLRAKESDCVSSSRVAGFSAPLSRQCPASQDRRQIRASGQQRIMRAISMS